MTQAMELEINGLYASAVLTVTLLNSITSFSTLRSIIPFAGRSDQRGSGRQYRVPFLLPSLCCGGAVHIPSCPLEASPAT